jgi:hypothetical protein
MDFKSAAKLGTYMSKDYAEDIFRLLFTYQNISASETASRLNLHIKTAQEFLDAMASLNFLAKEEVFEHKRPYFRYRLRKQTISMDIDLQSIFERAEAQDHIKKRVRERKNAGARFSSARDNQSISTVTIWIGQGRGRQERKINLTLPQGKFLFYLPFPSAKPLSISEIMKKAAVPYLHLPEIIDILELLQKYEIIDIL